MGVGAAIVGGTIIAGGMGLAGAAMSANSTEEASKTAAESQANATDTQAQLYKQQRADFEPFRQVGVGAIEDYNKMLKGGYDMKESPAAQYQLTQGTKALNRNLAARGLSGSGNAAQRLTELSSGIAASDYQNQYNRLADALKVGTGASAAMGQASNQYGNAVQAGAANQGNIAMNAGNARASLYGGIGGALTNTASTGLKAYQAYNNNTPEAPLDYTKF